MDWYFIVKTLHILGSTVLFGTGLGIAFFMFRSRYTEDLGKKLFAAQNTVFADYVFTFPAVFLQPITGVWLIWQGGYDWTEGWLVASYALFIFVGLCWLPVVWIQIRLKSLLLLAQRQNTNLPEQYHRLFRIWFILGWPAFLSVLALFYLMVAKPL